MDNKEVYADPQTGISFRKPDFWHFLSKKYIQKHRKSQVLAKGANELLEDFEWTEDELWEFFGEPLCVMTKYNPNSKKAQGQFSPTITVQATLKKSVLGLWGNKTFEDVIESSKENMTDILEGFQVLKEYGASKISGKKSYEFDTSYTFKHTDLKEPITVEMKSIKIETDQLFIDVNCHSSIQAKEICDAEISDFMKSIKINN